MRFSDHQRSPTAEIKSTPAAMLEISAMRRLFGRGPRVDALHRHQKPVPAPRQRFNITRGLPGIVQRLSQPLDGRIDTVLELDDGPVGPESVMQFLPRNHFAGVLQQHRQDLDGLIGKPDLDSVSTKLSRSQIQLERAKAEESGLG